MICRASFGDIFLDIVEVQGIILLMETSSIDRSNGFYDSFKRHLIGYRDVTNECKALSEKGLSACLTTLRLGAKCFTGIREKLYGHTQNRRRSRGWCSISSTIVAPFSGILHRANC